MVRNIVVLGGSSHPALTETICNHLGIPPAKIFLGKFAVGETRGEIIESVRGKDVFIIQSGGGKVNDNLMELLITVSACKTASAQRITVVLPLFPYSRQPDVPYNKVGAPLSKGPGRRQDSYTFDSRPQTPYPGQPESAGLTNGVESLNRQLRGLNTRDQPNGIATKPSPAAEARAIQSEAGSSQSDKGDTVQRSRRSSTASSKQSQVNGMQTNGLQSNGPQVNGVDVQDKAREKDQDKALSNPNNPQALSFIPQRGYKQWVAQAGTLVADLLTCAGADHVITMDLHDPQYQGFFDIPVDNLYGRNLLRRYIRREIPNYQDAVIVSPDAGGAKRATAIADALSMPFALIHKERRPTRITDRQNATMMLVGEVKGRTAILIDDLADTCNTITRAAKLVKKEGAATVYALVTHGIFSGDAIERINASSLDKVVCTNSVDQSEHERKCPKLQILEVGHVFAEAIRRVHHGESISALFDYD